MPSRPLKDRTWSWFISKILLPAGDRAFGQQMMQRYHFLQQAQWWDPQRVQAYRDEALAKLIRTSYAEVPFYRQQMEAAGVKPDDIRTAADLVKLPVVNKTMLRSGYPDQTTRDTGQKVYEACTSGSTGKNFCIKEDAWTAGWYRASFLLCLDWADWTFGEPHLQTGITLNRSIDRRIKDRLLRCHYVPAFDLHDDRLDENLEQIDRYKIDHVWGYPSSLYYLARRAKTRGWNRPLRSVITWGDMVYPRYREMIESTFGTQVRDTYGCCEGMHIAAQCGHDNQYHIHSLDVIVEYLDADNNPVDANQTGDVIVTRLHPGPMPLIRYRIGDRATRSDGQPCRCGRGFELMRGIQGRDTDCVVTPTGNRLIVHFFTGVLEHFQEVDSFQVIQNERDSVQIRIVPRQGFSRETEQHIASTLAERGAKDLRIDVETVTEIPLTPAGKRRFVINNLDRPSNSIADEGT